MLMNGIQLEFIFEVPITVYEQFLWA